MTEFREFLRGLLRRLPGDREKRASFEGLLEQAFRDRDGAALRIEALERALAELPSRERGSSRGQWH